MNFFLTQAKAGKCLKTSLKKHKENTPLSTALVNCHFVFDEYYSLIDNTAIYTAAILLHPQRRLHYLKKVWKPKWITPGLQRVKQLFQSQYQGKYQPPSEGKQPQQPTKELSTIEQFEQQYHNVNTSNDELTTFINGSIIFSSNPFDYWLSPSTQEQYPCLSQMAIDILSIHLMSADSECVFSGL